MWHHFFLLLFPKDSESVKILDIWLREVGAKRPLNGTSKVNRQTDTHTHRYMDKSTYRKHRPKGPMLWKYGFLGILGLPCCGIGATIRIGREMLCLPYAGFSKHRPSGPMLSISRNVRPSVCLSVCLSVCPCVHFLRYRLTIFLPPLPEIGCPIFLEIQNPWGKVMERSGLTFKHFCLEVV